MIFPTFRTAIRRKIAIRITAVFVVCAWFRLIKCVENRKRRSPHGETGRTFSWQDAIHAYLLMIKVLQISRLWERIIRLVNSQRDCDCRVRHSRNIFVSFGHFSLLPMLGKKHSNHGNKSQLVGTSPKKAVTEVTTQIHIYILFLKKAIVFYSADC